MQPHTKSLNQPTIWPYTPHSAFQQASTSHSTSHKTFRVICLPTAPSTSQPTTHANYHPFCHSTVLQPSIQPISLPFTQPLTQPFTQPLTTLEPPRPLLTPLDQSLTLLRIFEKSTMEHRWTDTRRDGPTPWAPFTAKYRINSDRKHIPSGTVWIIINPILNTNVKSILPLF